MLVGSQVLTTCSDAPLAPDRPRAAPIAISAAFPAASLSAFNLTLDNVRLILVHAGPTPDTLVDTLYVIPATATQIPLQATVELQQDAETLQVSLEYLSGGTLLFTDAGSTVVRPGTNPPATLPAPRYVGPGANIATLRLAPRDTTLTAGAVFPFRITAADSQANPVTAFYVSWTSSSASSTVDASGTVHAQPARGTFQIRAKTPTGITDSTGVTLTLPANLLVKVSGDGQAAAPAGSQLAQPLVVQVQASDGLGVPGVPVTFVASTGGGSVNPATAITDSAGKAQTVATLGPTAGPNSFTATSAVGQVTFSETGSAVTGAATNLFLATQPSATAQSGVALAQQPVVQLRDASNANVSQAGVPVTVSLTGGSGTVSGTLTVNTNANGQAVFTNLAISGTVGTRTLTFSSTGLTSVTSAAITLSAGPPAVIAAQNGNNQSATVGTTVAVAPTVLVTDGATNPVSGVSVTFAVATGGGTVVPTTPVVTGSNGLAAATSWTLGPTAGTNNNTLTATATGSGISGNPVTFTASATATTGKATWTGVTSTDWFTATNWNVGAVPSASDTVTIASGTPFAPTMTGTATVAGLTVQSGATLTLGVSSGLAILGYAAVTGAIAGDSTAVVTLAAASRTTLSGNIAVNVVITGNYLLNGNVNLSGHTLGVSGALSFGHTLRAGAFVTTANGALTMGTGDSLIVTSATFSGGSEVGALGGGVLVVSGDFVQNGTTSASSFSCGTGHKVLFTGAGVHNVLMTNPGSSTFGTVEVSGGADVRLASNAAVYYGGVTVSSGTFETNGFTLTDKGAFVTSGTSTLIMQQPTDSLLVSGAATFGGGSTAGLLTAGVLAVGGNFTQTGANSTSSFQPSGTHKTALTGISAQTLSFANPGASAFHDLDISGISGGSNTFSLASNIIVDSMLTARTNTPMLSGGGDTVTVGAFNVSGLIVDDAYVVLNEGAGAARPETFDGVTFQDFPTTGTTMLSISAIGGSLAPRALTFNNASFQALPVGAANFYVRLVSVPSGSGVALTMAGSNQGTTAGGNGQTNSSPANQAVSNGAQILWP